MAPPLATYVEERPPPTGTTWAHVVRPAVSGDAQRRDPVKRTFSGDLLKVARENRGLTQPDLAEQTGIPLSTIRNWEQGRSVPSVERLARVTIALGIRADDLLADTEDEV